MTTRGKILLTLVILGVFGFGAMNWMKRLGPQFQSQKPTSTTAGQPGNTARPANSTDTTANVPPTSTPTTAASGSQAPTTPSTPAIATAETLSEVQKLAPPGVYQPKDNVVEIELSEYAGYAGLIMANGGLLPSENSIFFKKYGFKVKLTLSEEESWSALNSGKIAGSATTVDVLAVYGRQFNAIVPAQIGFSRGADGVVVRSDIKRVNHLKGKVLATSQFTEAEFFIRYLAQEAGLGINLLPDLNTRPDPDKLNLVFCQDAFVAGDLFLQDVKEGRNKLAGCVTWDPKTSEVASQSEGKANILATSVNLLIVADILVVNKGFAQQNPDKVAALVGGLIEGNRLVRDTPEACLDTVGKAFKWDRPKTKSELAKVHLANLPENLAFFTGAIDAAGSFGGIYQSAILAYGSEIIKDPVDGDRFVDLKHLKALEQSGVYKEQKITISPIRTSTSASLENNPLLSKNIRFLFAPNSSDLDMKNVDNQKNLEAIKELLQVSPGSTILLRGHVDNALVEEFRRKGGETFLRQMALKAMELSKNRAAEIKRILVERFKLDATRLETVGRGWEEPIGTDNDQNRRVEAQWFTVE